MIDDAELLRRYAREDSQAAFAELVQRHVDLVYSAAVRIGGDPQQAEDVVQMVFRDLARKAANLARHPEIAGWLYTSARFAATGLWRSEQRRRRRETEAVAMNDIMTDAASTADLERLRPILDESISMLDPGDREAVLLRFFEKRPYAEIGAMLRVSEDTAQKRVDRALDKLRVRFARRGVTSTSGAVALLLSEQVLTAAPTGLAGTVSSLICASPAPTGAGGLGAATMAFMTSTKTSGSFYLVLLMAAAALSFWGSFINLVPAAAVAKSVPSVAPGGTRLGFGSLPVSPNAQPSPTAEFSSAVALEGPWLELFRRNPELMKAFLRMLGEATPALGMEVAERLRENGFQWTAYEVMHAWFAVDPVPAAAWYFNHRADQQLNVRPEAWAALAGAGGAEAIAAQIVALPSTKGAGQGGREFIAMNFATGWAKQDRAAAEAWVNLLRGDSTLFPRVVQGFVDGLAGPEEALNWALTQLPAGDIRKNALTHVVDTWTRLNPNRAEVEAWLLPRLAEPDLGNAAIELGKSYVESDPRKALAMLTPGQGDKHDQALAWGMFMLRGKDPAMAVKFIEPMAAGSLVKTNVIKIMAENWGSIDRAAAERYLLSDNPLSAEERALFARSLPAKTR
ncbi:MAG: hypothetical protein RL324_2191 [Verrucomicrobiota bacterium]|jgi:RNA polymerase sigma factor (sigma-70 family)